MSAFNPLASKVPTYNTTPSSSVIPPLERKDMPVSKKFGTTLARSTLSPLSESESDRVLSELFKAILPPSAAAPTETKILSPATFNPFQIVGKQTASAALTPFRVATLPSPTLNPFNAAPSIAREADTLSALPFHFRSSEASAGLDKTPIAASPSPVFTARGVRREPVSARLRYKRSREGERILANIGNAAEGLAALISAPVASPEWARRIQFMLPALTISTPAPSTAAPSSKANKLDFRAGTVLSSFPETAPLRRSAAGVDICSRKSWPALESSTPTISLPDLPSLSLGLPDPRANHLAESGVSALGARLLESKGTVQTPSESGIGRSDDDGLVNPGPIKRPRRARSASFHRSPSEFTDLFEPAFGPETAIGMLRRTHSLSSAAKELSTVTDGAGTPLPTRPLPLSSTSLNQQQ